MSLLDRLRGKSVTVENSEPNRIINVGYTDIHNNYEFKDSQNWIDLAPPKIIPSIKNCRKASRFPTVYGILNNLIMKSISSYVIDGADKDAVEHIIDTAKIWNLRNLMYECSWKNFVDGEVFYQRGWKDGHVQLRLLAFDGERALIKKIFDDDGVTVKGYKQLVVRRSALKKWKGIHFWETYQDSDVVTVDFEPDEISNPILISIDNVGQSLVKNVIDIAYYIESLSRQMPMIVFKSSNIMTATLGNADRGEYTLDEEARDYIAQEVSDYHKKGVITLPYGIELKNISSHGLPNVEDYIKSLKSMLYEGMISPESIYSSESSNRSTSQVQLTDRKTGYVLFIEFVQEFLKEWVEEVLIKPELRKHGFDEEGAYITFMTEVDDLDTNYLKASETHGVDSDSYTPTNEEGSTSLTTDDDPYSTYTGSDS